MSQRRGNFRHVFHSLLQFSVNRSVVIKTMTGSNEDIFVFSQTSAWCFLGRVPKTKLSHPSTGHKINNAIRISISAGPCAIHHRPEERLSFFRFPREWNQRFYCFQKYTEHDLSLTVDIFCISWLIDINECNDTSLFSCPNRTKCVNLQGNYTCECAPGYESTDSGKTRGMDIQCEGEIIFEPEGSGELELLKHFVFSNPQTMGNSRKHSGNSLKTTCCRLFG